MLWRRDRRVAQIRGHFTDFSLGNLPSALAAALADRYVLERELGHGGMATVYLARDLKHDRSVALKVLLPQLAQSLGIERFQREIKVAARLQHPHVLSVFDSGEAAGQLWFTMPYVRGESLRDRLRRDGPLPVDEALRIAREAAQALQHAHGEGVVHRDVKPENILLTSDGSTLVADFGIARALGEGAESSTHLTQTGMAIGTPAYMAPEQATGQRSIDARADQYALAVMLYEMLVGEPPFTGPSAGALVAQRFTQPTPSARRQRPDVPPGVDAALQRALSLESDGRFPTIAEFARALGPANASPVAMPFVAPTRIDSTVSPRRRVPVMALALGVVAIAGMAGLFAWRRARSAAGEHEGPRVLAVLPFENLGDSADAYFAEGVANEVRSKLTQLGGLAVIARVSSNEYRHTNRRPEQIAHELGADYLLTGTVQWLRGTGGTSRVRVSPELVEVAGGRAPSTKWAQPFDAALTDVFQVQADIAQKVAGALGVALADSARRDLSTAPTTNLGAYDAYLKAEAASVQDSSLVGDLHRSIGFYEQAVALDSTYLNAWVQLARLRSFMVWVGASTPDLERAALAAVERAEHLAPDRAESRLARVEYCVYVLQDAQQAITAAAAGLAKAPNDAELLASAALAERLGGRWEESLRHALRAARLDPRSAAVARVAGEDLVWMRRYPQARAELDRGAALAPMNGYIRLLQVMSWLGEGNLEGARRVVDTAEAREGRLRVIASLASYNDLYWVLSEAQQQELLKATPAAFDGDRANWAHVRAQVHALRGEAALARAWADTAQAAFAAQLAAAPMSRQNAQTHVLRAIDLAYLGRKSEAIDEATLATTIVPVSASHTDGAYFQHQFVRTLVILGEHERALDLLDALLRIPYFVSPAWLRIDPNFAPLRGNLRFERLVAGG